MFWTKKLPTEEDLRKYDSSKDKMYKICSFGRFMFGGITATSGRWTTKGRFRRFVEFEKNPKFYVLIITIKSKQWMIFLDR